jgi:hypothetical protein
MDWGSPDLKLVCFKGNHEDIMWQCCRQPIQDGWHGRKVPTADYPPTPPHSNWVNPESRTQQTAR